MEKIAGALIHTLQVEFLGIDCKIELTED